MPLFSFPAAGLFFYCSCFASARCFDALRLLNMTDEKKCIIPSVAEEYRENEPLGLITAIAKIRKVPLIDLYADFSLFHVVVFAVFIFVKKRG